MKFRSNTAFLLLAVFLSVQVADVFDTLPYSVKDYNESISIRSNDLPFALVNSQTREVIHISYPEKTTYDLNFSELKRYYSILIKVSFNTNFFSLVERPANALYMRLLRLLI